MTNFRRELTEKLAYTSHSNCLCFCCETRLHKTLFGGVWPRFPEKWTSTHLPRAPEGFDLITSFWMLPCIGRWAIQQQVGKKWSFSREFRAPSGFCCPSSLLLLLLFYSSICGGWFHQLLSFVEVWIKSLGQSTPVNLKTKTDKLANERIVLTWIYSCLETHTQQTHRKIILEMHILETFAY